MKKDLLCSQVERQIGNMSYSLEYDAETGNARLLVSSDAFGEKSRKLYSRKLTLGKRLHRSQLTWVLGSIPEGSPCSSSELCNAACRSALTTQINEAHVSKPIHFGRIGACGKLSNKRSFTNAWQQKLVPTYRSCVGSKNRLSPFGVWRFYLKFARILPPLSKA